MRKFVYNKHYANAKENILLKIGGNFMQPPTRRHLPAWGVAL
jgi:hypothetical protein